MRAVMCALGRDGGEGGLTHSVGTNGVVGGGEGWEEVCVLTL